MSVLFTFPHGLCRLQEKVGDVLASAALRKRGITLGMFEGRPCPGTSLSQEDASSTGEASWGGGCKRR